MPAPRVPSPHGRRTIAALFFLLILIGIAWRLPYAITRPISSGDETQYSLATIEHLEHGEFLTFIYGTDYGAPIHEWMSVCFRKLMGPSPVALRLPVVLFGSLAAATIFLSLRSAVSTQAAFLLALPLACPPSSPAFYTVYSQPAYSAILFFVAAIQLGTFAVARRRSLGRWALLGLIAGAAYYVFKLSVLQSGASVLWLFLKSEIGAEILASFQGVASRRRFIHVAILWGVAAFLLSPVAYRALTRRAVYHMSGLEMALAAAAAVCVLAGMVFASRLVRWKRGHGFAALVFAVAFSVLPALAARHFAVVEKPRLTARGIVLYAEATYSLKHAHEWPFQAKLLFERVLPALLFGGLNGLEGFPLHVHPGWKTALVLALATTVAAAGFYRCRRGFKAEWLTTAPDVLIIAPFFLVVALIFPSWQLHGDFCYRYLMPFFPGLLLLVYRCFEPLIDQWRKTSIALLAIYLLYCGIDCHSQFTALPSPAIAAVGGRSVSARSFRSGKALSSIGRNAIFAGSMPICLTRCLFHVQIACTMSASRTRSLPSLTSNFHRQSGSL